MTQIRILEIRIYSSWELQKVGAFKPAVPPQFADVTTSQDAPWTGRNDLGAMELVQEEEK